MDKYIKFFHWGKEINVLGQSMYQRVVPQYVIEKARTRALVESRKMRQKLMDENSDEFVAYIAEVYDYDKAVIVEFLAQQAAKEAAEQYIRNTPRPVVPQPDEDSVAAAEQYEEARRLAEQAYEEDVLKRAEDVYKTAQSSLSNLDRDVLIERYKQFKRDMLCEEVFMREFEDYIVCNSLFVDREYKKPVFSLEEFKELPARVRDMLKDSYNDLSLSYDDIKN